MSSGLQASPIAVRSDFVRQLTVPGKTDNFVRPGRVVFDPIASEIYVADQGRNRIVIFGVDGAYRFEFNLAGRIGSIIDFAVSPSGLIYVLGSSQQGRKLLTFDFDGLFVGEMDPSIFTDKDITSVATDHENRIYLLDHSGLQVLILSPSGEIANTIPVVAGTSERLREDVVLGTLSTTDDGFLLPISSFGMVYRYTLDGEHVKTYGYKGSVTGELAFPVSAAVTGNGLITVLDKQRFAILLFAPDGRCVGEFGGKGRRDGWFYFPSYLTADAGENIIISQVFLNRVQVCRIPDAINERFESLLPVEGETVDEASHSAAESDSRNQQDKTEVLGLVDHFQRFPTKGGL